MLSDVFILFVFIFMLYVVGFSTLSETTPYELQLVAIKEEQEKLSIQYQKSSGKAAQAKIRTQARRFIEATITLQLFDAWYGTKWDFNGTTEQPQSGKIACGYFISTILRDVGFKVERVKLARQASEKIVRSLAPESQIKRFSKTSLKQFVTALKNMGNGLYVVGLDTHVGFLWVDGSTVSFVHASRLGDRGVVKEPALKSPTLKRSKYRIIGKILADDALIEHWLLYKDIKTQL